MEKCQIAALVNSFDHFVELSLKSKTSEEGQEDPQENQIYNYLAGMEKRLKLKPPSHQQKFQKMLAPMKGLKSFVSVREFLQKLGYSHGLGKRRRTAEGKVDVSVKEQYESARGGFYLHKIEEHLKQQNFSRGQVNGFVTELESDPLLPSDYCSWMENALGRINPKQECLFRLNTEAREVNKLSEEDCLIQEHKQIYHQQFKVVPHIRQICNQEYNNFTKISSLLTNRLRKLLKTNGASRNSKIKQFDVAAAAKGDSKRYFSQRTAVGISKSRFKVGGEPSKAVSRAKTAGSCRKEDTLWRQSVNNRIRYILETETKQNLDF